jgi:hypothetical protein
MAALRQEVLYMKYPKFRRKLFRLQDDLPCPSSGRAGVSTLKKKCVSTTVKAMVGNKEGLDEVWETLYTRSHCLERYIAEEFKPVIKLRK